MPEAFVDPNDLDEILRSKEEIAREQRKTGLGATPNEVAAGLADPDFVVPDPERDKRDGIKRDS
jgi:hypothetical protein